MYRFRRGARSRRSAPRRSCSAAARSCARCCRRRRCSRRSTTSRPTSGASPATASCAATRSTPSAGTCCTRAEPPRLPYVATVLGGTEGRDRRGDRLHEGAARTRSAAGCRAPLTSARHRRLRPQRRAAQALRGFFEVDAAHVVHADAVGAGARRARSIARASSQQAIKELGIDPDKPNPATLVRAATPWTDFKLPELGENIDAADVARVLVNVGDTITKDQPVVELETDKATVEVPSSVAGVVKAINVKAGAKVKVGDVVLTVDDGAGRGAASERPGAARRVRRAGSRERGPRRAGEAAARRQRRAVDRGEGRRGGQRRPAAERRPIRRPAPTSPEPWTPSRNRSCAVARKTETARRARSCRCRAARAARPSRRSRFPASRRRPRRRRSCSRIAACRRRRPRRAAAGARDRRRHRHGAGHRARRTHHAGRRQGARAPHPVEHRLEPRRGAAATCRPLPDFSKWGEVERKPMSGDPPQDGGAPVLRVDDDPARHAVRQGRHHRARGAAQAARDAGGGAGRQADGHRHPRARCWPRRCKQYPAVQRRRWTWTPRRSSTSTTSTSAWRWTPIAACWCPSSATSDTEEPHADRRRAAGAGGEGARQAS